MTQGRRPIGRQPPALEGLPAVAESRRKRRQSESGSTITDVAQRASVSAMTVSRVINNSGYVRAETREKVREAIDALSYAPNSDARTLSTGASLKVALLYENPSSGFLGELLVGALDESTRAGAQLTVLRYELSAGAAGLLQALRAHGAQAVLLPPPLCEAEPVLAALAETDVCVVGLATSGASPMMSTVRINNEQAGREIADHLLFLGHRRFGVITGWVNQSGPGKRCRGFTDQLGRGGIPASDIAVQHGSFTYRSGLEVAERLLSAERRPTAIFAENDDMAAAALSVAHRLGIHVPRDLSIVGFDDTPLASELWPPLTTISQPVADMAAAAIKIAVDAIWRRRTGVPEHEDIVLPYSLIVRGSTPAPEA